MRAHCLLALFAIAAITLITTRGEAAPYNLYLAFDSSTTACQSNTTAFFDCILKDTNFNTLTVAYPAGQALTLAGSKALTKYCAPTDFQCVIDDTGFAPNPYDVVLHFYGTSWNGGTNGQRTVTVGGKSITINVSWVNVGNSCDGQTCSGAHEAYEAATDGVSADCCNGQQPPLCPSCRPSCSAYTGSSSKYCYALDCGGKTYQMQLVSPKSNEFEASGCLKLSALTPACGALHDTCAKTADCCSGLTCKTWSESGKPPYDEHCCHDVGATCGVGTDCCGGMACDPGTKKCVCVPEGQWCVNADECCAGATCDLAANKCVALAVDAGVDARADAADASVDSGHVVADASAGDDTGSDAAMADDSSKGGCSCGTAPLRSRGSVLWSAGGLLFAAVIRRRRQLTP